MTKFLARVRVIATAAPTILTGLAVVVNVAGAQLGADWPGAPKYAGMVATTLLAIVATIRRVMPVAKNQRGVLPPN